MFVTSCEAQTVDAMHRYPFEQLSEDAKRTLVLAQEEAELARRGYIGTEHLLLGMLRLGSGSAHRALANLNVEAASVRKMIDAALAHAKHPAAPQVVPTARVKRVIEIAFDGSRRMRAQQVESGHLLIGLAKEGEGIACLVLQDLGIGVERVAAEVEREFAALSHRPGKATKSQLDNRPPHIQALQDKLASVRFALKHAVEAKDTEHAVRLGYEENKLEKELDEARQKWLDSLG